MGDRCYSTVICSGRDQKVFEDMGYKLDEAQAVIVGAEDIPGVILMVDEEANGGHNDELTTLHGVPFLASNTACPGAYGDHVLVSDGREWNYSEALHESNYPAVRVERGGAIAAEDLRSASEYWRVYDAALETLRERARACCS